jgi:probable selenium-dependent hydroxylase accessory protein YqeC
MKLEEAFGLQEREVVSVAGGGGKTTLLFALAGELSTSREGIILTTTTKIWAPEPSPSFGLFLSTQFSVLRDRISRHLGDYPYLIVAQERLSNGKLRGIPPLWVESLAAISGVSILLVEADGAAGRSLKAPREDEPVLPGNTSLLVPVVGIDVLGCPLDEQHVFRAELAARLLRRQTGGEVTPEIIASLLGLIPGKRPSGARVIPFINKVDLPGSLEKSRALGRYLLNYKPLEAERVLLGNARLSPPVRESLENPKP